MIEKVTIILLLVGSTSSASLRKDLQKTKIGNEPTLETLLDALHSLMVFFSERYDKLNVDGLFGIRAVEGEMLRALSLARSGVYTTVKNDPEIKSKMEEILQIAQHTAERALPEVKKKNEKYYMNFLPVIGQPWTMFQVAPQKISTIKEEDLPDPLEKTREEGQSDDFDENQSDMCMGTLLGNEKERCDVNSCWDRMTRRGTKLYYTTHQILWFQLGMSAGCQQQFEEKAPDVGGIEKIFRRLCGNDVFQMDALFQHGTVEAPFQDIFLEKGMVCGGAGFVDAVNITWLEEVMNWQHSKFGCFREIDTGGIDLDMTSFNKWLLSKKSEWRSRNLLEDMEMGDRCSAHKSAVAAGFYAVYTRLFLDPEYRRLQQMPAFFGELGLFSSVNSSRIQYFVLGFFIVVFIAVGIGPRRRNQVFRLIFCRRK